MARIPMVTRTMHTTKATLLVVDIDAQATDKVVVDLPRTYKDESAIIKAAESKVDSNFKIVKVLDTEVQDILYGMEENFFFENANILPPRSVKEKENENE